MTVKQMDILELIKEGQALREKGLQEAIDHANGVSPQWSQRAYNVAVDYVKNELQSGQPFKTEDIRVWAYLHDKLPKPPNERAWGGVCGRMAGNGLIEKIGNTTVVNPKAHGAIATLWKKK